MSAPCSVCEHPDRRQLDAAVAAGQPLARLAKSHAVSRYALRRHRDRHLAPRVAAARAEREAADHQAAGTILDRLERLAGAAERAAYEAMRAGVSYHPAAVREARETLVRIGEVNGDLQQQHDGNKQAKSVIVRLVEGLAEQRETDDDQADKDTEGQP